MQKILKKLVILLTALFLVALNMTSVSAASFMNEQDLVLDQEVSGDLYLVGQNLSLEKGIQGDLFVAGQYLNVNGAVSDDLNVAGQVVRLTGNVSDDIRALGQTIYIESEVNGDLMSAGQILVLTDKSKIQGEAYLAGEEIQIRGTISGKSVINANKVVISGQMNNDVEITAESITFSDQGKINGNLTYTATRKLNLDQNRISGKIQYQQDKTAATSFRQETQKYTQLLLNALWAFLSALLIGILIIFFFAPCFNRLSTSIGEHHLLALGIGWLFLILAIIISAILMITFLRLPLMITHIILPSGMILLLLWGIILYLGEIMTALAAAAWVLKNKKNPSKWLMLLFFSLALIVMHLLYLQPLPYIYLIFWLICVPTGIGACLICKWQCYTDCCCKGKKNK